MMRILHLLNTHIEAGNGIVNVAIDLACLQAKMGHSVAIASSKGDFEALLAAHGVEVFSLPLPVGGSETRSSRLSALPNAVLGLRRLVRRWRPDIIHAHMVTGVILVRLGFLRPAFRLVSTVHNEFQRSAPLMGFADRVIAVSNAVAANLKRRGIHARKIAVVPNGPLETPRRASAPLPLPLALQHPAVLTVGGLYERKGIADLIAAFEIAAATVPEAHLYIVGDGPAREVFRAQAEGSSVAGRIHFEGFQRDPRPYMLASDVFVLASHREPFGLVIPEARACGCAIIASNVDGIPETVDGGTRGILVAARQPAALATALVDLLTDSAGLAAWRVRAAEGLEWLSASRVARDTLAVYADA